MFSKPSSSRVNVLTTRLPWTSQKPPASQLIAQLWKMSFQSPLYMTQKWHMAFYSYCWWTNCFISKIDTGDILNFLHYPSAVPFNPFLSLTKPSFHKLNAVSYELRNLNHPWRFGNHNGRPTTCLIYRAMCSRNVVLTLAEGFAHSQGKSRLPKVERNFELSTLEIRALLIVSCLHFPASQKWSELAFY